MGKMPMPRKTWAGCPCHRSVGDASMPITPNIPLKPLDFSRGLKASENVSKVMPQTLDPNQRNVKQVTGDEHAKLTEKTQQWVAQTFFGTLLKQMEESPF